MSPRRSPTEGTGGGGRVAVTVLVVAIVAIGMLLLVRARPTPEAFDPRSSRADGARALVLLLEGEGAAVDVTRDVPAPGADARVLVLADRLGDDQRIAVLDFVEAGGLVVVADPASSLHGGPGLDGGSREVAPDRPPEALGDAESESDLFVDDSCTIAALGHLRGVFTPRALLFPTAPDDEHCLGDGADTDHAFVIRRHLGAGSVVGLGDNHVFTNEYLRYADNSGLATALLAPSNGRVVVLIGDRSAGTPEDLGSGDDTLADLVRPGVWMAFAELALAFAVFAVARGVRAGRYVDEPLPSPLAGSDFVRARASLMQRARHAAAAGDVLRADLHRELCAAWRLPPGSPVDTVAGAAAERGLDPDAVRIALTAGTPGDTELHDLAVRHARLRAGLASTISRPAALAGTGPSEGAPR